MSNRKLAYIVKDQKPLALGIEESVARACRLMWRRRAGSVLAMDSKNTLAGILTGRDAVRLLAEGSSGKAHLAQAMTPNPITLTPRHRAIDALKAMADGNFRHVPIIENGKLLGVVSRGDFKGMEFEEFDWDASHLRNAITPNREVSSIISDQTPLARSADETLQSACFAMRKSGSGSVLVWDPQGQLVGIFTGRDAIRAISEDDDAGSKLLKHAMKPNPVTIAPDSHAIDALRTMSDRGFRHLPVMENGKIYGVVSRSDFTGVEIDRLDEDEHLAECIW
jgi:CBS domain-containing protein